MYYAKSANNIRVFKISKLLSVYAMPGETGKTLHEQIEKIKARNPVLNCIRDVNNVLLGESRK